MTTYNPDTFDINNPDTYPPKQWPCWHMHHDSLWEFNYDFAGRLDYIRSLKPISEIPTRIKLMTPVRNRARLLRINRTSNYDPNKAKALTEKLHSEEHPYCSWDGTTVIFPI